MLVHLNQIDSVEGCKLSFRKIDKMRVHLKEVTFVLE